MRTRRPNSLISLIENALRAASYDTASFEDICGSKEITLKESEVTTFIRERTRLHRETWIIAPLKEALKKLSRNSRPRFK